MNTTWSTTNIPWAKPHKANTPMAPRRRRSLRMSAKPARSSASTPLGAAAPTTAAGTGRRATPASNAADTANEAMSPTPTPVR